MKDSPEEANLTHASELPSQPLLAEDPLLTVEEVATYLKVAPSTVRTMAKKGLLRAVKVGRAWRFKQSAIREALSKTFSVT